MQLLADRRDFRFSSNAVANDNPCEREFQFALCRMATTVINEATVQMTEQMALREDGCHGDDGEDGPFACDRDECGDDGDVRVDVAVAVAGEDGADGDDGR